jgi:cytosine/creatinine deaminase
MEGKYKPKGEFEREVRGFCSEFGGIVNAHVHGDRAYTRRDDYYSHVGVSVSDIDKLTLPEKQQLTWALHTGRAFEKDCIEERMRRMIDESIYFGVKQIFTTVDVTYNTKLKSLDVAEKLRDEYAGKLDLKIGIYNTSGFKEKGLADERFELFEEASKRCDFLMGLAEKDRSKDHMGERQHNSYMLQLAYKTGKPAHFHVGQENRHTDNTLELLLDEIKEVQDVHLRVGFEDFPEIVAVHAISSSCKDHEMFDNVAYRMAQRNIGLICCPRAAISMLQDSSLYSPTHNSIAKVWDFAIKGVKIKGLGVDNLDDIFVPATSADVYDETEDLANSLRSYRQRILAKVMCGEDLDEFDVGDLRRTLFS